MHLCFVLYTIGMEITSHHKISWAKLLNYVLLKTTERMYTKLNPEVSSRRVRRLLHNSNSMKSKVDELNVLQEKWIQTKHQRCKRYVGNPVGLFILLPGGGQEDYRGSGSGSGRKRFWVMYETIMRKKGATTANVVMYKMKEWSWIWHREVSIINIILILVPLWMSLFHMVVVDSGLVTKTCGAGCIQYGLHRIRGAVPTLSKKKKLGLLSWKNNWLSRIARGKTLLDSGTSAHGASSAKLVALHQFFWVIGFHWSNVIKQGCLKRGKDSTKFQQNSGR